jgi:Zn-finger nucleic acid-binding protein
MSLMQGIEIDYCTNCRGVWLDRGELDKIIERTSSSDSMYSNDRDHDGHHQNHSFIKHNDSHDNHYGNRNYNDHSGHKKGFLSQLFDF